MEQNNKAADEVVLQARSPEGDPWMEVAPDDFYKAKANGYETRVLYVQPAAPAVDAAKLDDLDKLKALAEAANGTEPMGDAWLNLLGATTPDAILRIAALVAQQAARIAELEARSRSATDAEVAAWAERHDIVNQLGGGARAAFEDAESLHMTYKEGK